ncbi:MAG: hypothetical protein ACI9LM_005350, partial [Alteromonadaceae bacterium]
SASKFNVIKAASWALAKCREFEAYRFFISSDTSNLLA